MLLIIVWISLKLKTIYSQLIFYKSMKLYFHIIFAHPHMEYLAQYTMGKDLYSHY